MRLATWAAVFILGVGSTAVFIWFLVDFFRRPPGTGHTPPDEP
jgi:hypothetical protein